MYLKNVKAILPIIILTALLNMFYTADGNVIFNWWIITLTVGGITRALFMALRIILLILASAVLSYTTSPTSLTGAIESLLKPLSLIGLKNAVHTMAMTMTIALRFIPTLIEETDKIMCAQKARGADFESGNIFKRAKALVPLLVPLFISAFRRANDLAMAMEARCYRGGEHRTKMKPLHYEKRDYVAYVIVACYLVVGIVVGNVLPVLINHFFA